MQEWHVDDSMVQHKNHRYFTVLINLNPLDAYCGGTEVWIDKLKKGDLVSSSFRVSSSFFFVSSVNSFFLFFFHFTALCFDACVFL